MRDRANGLVAIQVESRYIYRGCSGGLLQGLFVIVISSLTNLPGGIVDQSHCLLLCAFPGCWRATMEQLRAPTACAEGAASILRSAEKSVGSVVSLTLATDALRWSGLTSLDNRPLLVALVPVSVLAGGAHLRRQRLCYLLLSVGKQNPQRRFDGERNRQAEPVHKQMRDQTNQADDFLVSARME